MKRRGFLALPFLGLLGCIKEEIKPVRASRLFSTFNGIPTPPAPSYSTEYQAVLDRALILGAVWTSTTESSNPTVLEMDGANIIQLGNFVYIIGGWNGNATPRAQKTVYVAPIADLTSWTQLADAPWDQRHSFGCEVLNNQIFIWGADAVTGNSSHDCWAATQDANGVLTWTLKCATLPYSYRAIFGTCLHNGYLYTIGGESYSSDTAPTDVWRSSDGITWTKVGDGISDFGGNLAGGAVSFNGKLYTFGGGRYYVWSGSGNYQSHTYINSIYVSSDNGVTWGSAANNLPTATQYTRCVVFDSKVWVVQGINQGDAVNYMDTSEVVTTPTIVNRYWANNYHAVSGCKITVNGVDKLCCSHGTGGPSQQASKYVVTIAKSYSGYDAPTDTQKGYQDTLMGLLKSNSWLTGTGALKCFYAFNYGSSGFSTINWVSSTLYQLTRSATAPTWTDGLGFRGNGTSTSLIPSSFDPSALSNISETNCSVFAYICDATMTTGLRAIFGGDRSNTRRLYLAPKYDASNGAAYMFGSTDFTFSQNGTGKGLWHILRDNSSNIKIYRDRTLLATVVNSSSAGNIVSRVSILCGHSSTPERFSDAQLSCFGFGPAVDNTALNDVWDAYKTLTGL